MKVRFLFVRLPCAMSPLLACVSIVQAQIHVTGVAVITDLPCYAADSQVPKVGQTRMPVRTPVPCAATASMAGYQPYSFSLP